jgi:hypothetical protein
MINIYFLFVVQATRSKASSLARLVEGDLMRAALRPAVCKSRFGFDYQLACALLDWWHPKTHNFHFLWGEMAVTLEGVALLFGLPCSGEPMGVVDPPMRGATISSRGSPEWCGIPRRQRFTYPTHHTRAA